MRRNADLVSLVFEFYGVSKEENQFSVSAVWWLQSEKVFIGLFYYYNRQQDKPLPSNNHHELLMRWENFEKHKMFGVKPR